jgi:PAS domain S-box-containing protein
MNLTIQPEPPDVQALLHEREAELERVQRIGRIGGFEIDLRDGHFHNRRSPEYLRLHNLPDDATGEPHDAWVRRLHPQDRTRVEAGFIAAVNGTGRDYAAEYRVNTPNGVRWIAAVGEIERDAGGAPLHMVGVHIDITRTKLAETALLASTERLREVLEAIGEAYFALDADERFTSVSRRALEIWGMAEADVIGRRLDDVVPGAETGGGHGAIRAAMRDGLPNHAELQSVSLRGRWIEQDVYPTRDGGAAIAFRDIDDRKRAEQALRRVNENLELRVREEVAAREATQARLQQAQRLEALGQLAGGIAHDFNNVLQAIQSGVGLISRRTADAAVLRLAAMVREAAARGASVTRRLLAFSRRDELKVEPIDPGALLADLREMLAHTLGGQVSVEIGVDPGLPELTGDKGQLETVLINLATNARDAMQGAGTLAISATRQTVADAAPPIDGIHLAPGAYVRFAVRDTGTGMDAATLARAAEPFFTTKPVGAGTGLGLSMARGFAVQSGGALQIDSAAGQGTTVALWLPATGPVPAAPQQGTTARQSLLGVRVLLTDDDPLVCEMLADELEAAGLAVLRAGEPATALALLDAGIIIDVLVSDVSTARPDALNLIEAARRRQPGLPAILLTGAAVEQPFPEMEALAVLRKPMSGAELAQRIEALLESQTLPGSRRLRE